MGNATGITAAELLRQPIAVDGEQEYRRGYCDGFLATLDAMSEGYESDWLYRFLDFVLAKWEKGQSEFPLTREILPPLCGFYKEEKYIGFRRKRTLGG